MSVLVPNIITKSMHDFVIPEGCFWEDVRKAPIDKKNQKLNDAVTAIADKNIDANGKYILKGIINTVRWNEAAPDGSGGKKLNPEVLSNLVSYLDAVAALKLWDFQQELMIKFSELQEQ